MLEVLKFAGYAIVGGALVFIAMRYAHAQYDAGYRDGRADRCGLQLENERRRNA